MNNLTTQNIQDTSEENYPEVTFLPVTIAYIQELLTPYAKAVENVTTIEQLEIWVKQRFTDTHETYYMKALNSGVPLNDMKSNIIEHLLDELLEESSTTTLAKKSHYVSPWDIQSTIQTMPDLYKIYGVEGNTLPVTVTVGGKQYTHMLTEEFTVGLLLYASSNVGNKNYNITMFGVEFHEDYLLRDEHNGSSYYLFEYRDDIKFSVTVANQKYAFDTPDFMQGFITGATWSNEDHHKYWSHLKEYSKENMQGIEITF